MRVALRVIHPALGGGVEGVAIGAARLTDKQRLGILLQASGLLSLLERGGWHLRLGWPAARVTAAGDLLLAPEAVAPGRSVRHSQEMLRDLLGCLFGAQGASAAQPSGEVMVAGRGEARRAARALLALWWQLLVPHSPDQAAAQILEAAPFLWGPAYGAARAALAGELHGPDGVQLWVAGPGSSRARLLAGVGRLAEVAARLGGGGARALWEERGEAGPLPGAGSRSWWRVVASFRRRPPATDAERLDLARAYAALGRSAAALEALAPLRTVGARALRARCQLQLGRLGAARATLRRLQDCRMSPVEAVELAEVAARLFANSGEPERGESWIERALALGQRGADRELLVRARLAAALAAWDRQDPAAMDRHLALAGATLGSDAAPPWLWHHACGLRAMAAADGAAVVIHLGRAIRADRHGLGRHEAGGLWNDLGIGRVQAGDLAGAERAFLHALRLLGSCDGPRKTTLALHNLAEVRLRRGRLAGVREILERSSAENRLAGNVRGLIQDVELLARYELVVGRPEAALTLCRAAVRDLAPRHDSWRRAALAVLAARALGWLGRAVEASEELVATTPETRAELEPEERPALRALAGQRELALLEAAGLSSPTAALWRGVLAGAGPPAAAWEALAQLEPFRAARLVFDLEAAAPRSVPPHWLRAAIATFRQLGASEFAERLEAADLGPWQALVTYAARRPGDPLALSALFAQAGYSGAVLAWHPAPDAAKTKSVSAPGEGASPSPPTPPGRPAHLPLPALPAGRDPAASDNREGDSRAVAGGDPIDASSRHPPPHRSVVSALGIAVPSSGDGGSSSAAPQVLRAELPGGLLTLTAAPAGPGDAALAALFALAVRDFGARLAGADSLPPAWSSAAAAAHHLSRRSEESTADRSHHSEAPDRSRSAAHSGRAQRSSGDSGQRVGGDSGRGERSRAAAAAGRTDDDGRAMGRAGAGRLLGESLQICAARQRIALLAGADIPVLIQGESGTGKELAARAIHGASSRSHAPFLPVNCAAVAESLLLSDLFGHVRGAFTGAERDRAGIFETAAGGTVLLDEIGDLPLAAQGMLLRLLQEREVRRLGESLPRRVDVRVLAATHRDLSRAVAERTFRQDLFYRLRVGFVELPPLRDRAGDVALLAEHFLRRPDLLQSGKAGGLSAAARARLACHSWPGNVRELENVLRLAAALSGGGTIEPRHLELPLTPAAAAAASYHQQLETRRRELVLEALAAAGGRHAEAARRLGISRQALSYLVRQLGLK
ncbi:MAG TPA: sigma 54-interacting transcriptional regulator [Thermoanaerobaculia bacterium]|nr:sigma 54-interacting transcriptional regulator [Thermoanaerobaculia bacterium]